MNSVPKLKTPAIVPLDEEDRFAKARKIIESKGPALLRFKKGAYVTSDDTPIPVGTKVVVYAEATLHGWVKLVRGEPPDRTRLGRIIDGYEPCSREDLGAMDKSAWPPGPDGKPSSPWVFQHCVPVEVYSSGDRYMFISATNGGEMAVYDIFDRYIRANSGNRRWGLPIATLAVSVFKSKNFGPTQRPEFRVVSWENGGGTVVELAAPSPKVSPSTDAIDKPDLSNVPDWVTEDR